MDDEHSNTCPVCTFRNEPGSSVCEVCETHLPLHSSLATGSAGGDLERNTSDPSRGSPPDLSFSSPPPAAQSTEWPCAVCTFLNRLSSSRCAVCSVGERPPQSSSERRSGSRRSDGFEDDERSSPSSSNLAMMLESLSVGNPSGPFGYPRSDVTRWFSDWEEWSVKSTSPGETTGSNAPSNSVEDQSFAKSAGRSSNTRSSEERLGDLLLPSLVNLASSSSASSASTSRLSNSSPLPLSQGGAFSDAAGRAALRLAGALAWRQGTRRPQSAAFLSLRNAESTAHVFSAAINSNLAVDVSLSIDLIRLLLFLDKKECKDDFNSILSSQYVFAKNLLRLGAAHSVLGLTLLAVASSSRKPFVELSSHESSTAHESEFTKALVEATLSIVVTLHMSKNNGSRTLPSCLSSVSQFKEFVLIPFAKSFHGNGSFISTDAKEILLLFLSDSLLSLTTTANEMQNVSSSDSIRDALIALVHTSPNISFSVYELEVSGVVDAFCRFFVNYVMINDAKTEAKRVTEILSSMGTFGLSLVAALQGRVGTLSSKVFRGDIVPGNEERRTSSILKALHKNKESVVSDNAVLNSCSEDENVCIDKCVFDLAKERAMSVATFLARPSKDAWNNLQGSTRLKGEGAVDVNVTFTSIKGIDETKSSSSLSEDVALRVLLGLPLVPASALSASTAPITGTFGPGVASIINTLPGRADLQKNNRSIAPSSAHVRARANPSFGRVVMSMQQPIAVRLIPNVCDPVLQLIGLAPIAVCTDAPSLPPIDFTSFPAVISPSTFSSSKAVVSSNGLEGEPITDLLPPYLSDVDAIVSASLTHNAPNESSSIAGALTAKSTSAGPVERSSLTSIILNSTPPSTNTSVLLLAHSGSQLVVPVCSLSSTQHLKLLDSTVPTALWVDPLLSLVEVHSSVLPNVQSDLNTLRNNIATQAMAIQVEILKVVRDVQTARASTKLIPLSPSAALSVSSPRAGSGAICRFYGKASGCKFGNSCRFVHIGPGGVIVGGGAGGGEGGGQSRGAISSVDVLERTPPTPAVIPTIAGISQVFESLDQEVEDCTGLLFANRSEATVAMAKWSEEHILSRNESSAPLSSETPEIAPNTARVGSSAVHSHRGYGQSDDAMNEDDGVLRDYQDEEQHEGEEENEDNEDGDHEDDDENDEEEMERQRIQNLLSSALAGRSSSAQLSAPGRSRELAASAEFAEHAAALISGLRGNRASSAVAAAAAAAAALSAAGSGVGGLGAAFSASLLSGGLFGVPRSYGRASGGAGRGRGGATSDDALYSQITQERTLEERLQSGELPMSSPADFESFYKSMKQGTASSGSSLLDLYTPPEEDPLQFVLRLVEDSRQGSAVDTVTSTTGLSLTHSDQPIVGHSNGQINRKGSKGLLSYWLPPSPADKLVDSVVEMISETSARQNSNEEHQHMRGGGGVFGETDHRMFGRNTTISNSYPWMLNVEDRIAFKAAAAQTERSSLQAPWVSPRKSRPVRVFRHSTGISNSSARQSVLESITNINDADAPRQAIQAAGLSPFVRESLMVMSSTPASSNYVPVFPSLEDAIATIRKPEAEQTPLQVRNYGSQETNAPFVVIRNHSVYVTKFCDLRNDISEARAAFSSLQRQGQTSLDDPAWMQFVASMSLINDKRLSHLIKSEKKKPSLGASVEANSSPLTISVNNEEDCMRKINDLREQLRTLRFLHEASRAVAIRGLWFAVHISNGDTEVTDFAVCVWGAQMGDYTLLEKLACELSANPKEVQNAAKRLEDLMSSPASVHVKEMNTASSTSPWERVHRISFGTLGPHPLQRPPQTLLVKNIHMQNEMSQVPVVVDSVSTSGHLHPQSALPALTTITRIVSDASSMNGLSTPTIDKSISVSVTRDGREDKDILSSNLMSESIELTAPTALSIQMNTNTSTNSKFLPAKILHSLFSASSLLLAEESNSVAKIAAATEFGSALTDVTRLSEGLMPEVRMGIGLLKLSHSLSPTSHSVCSALASVLTDPLSVLSHTTALSSGRGKPSWPSLLVLVIEAPHLVPVALRQAYFELCGFGLIRSMHDFESRWRGRAKSLAISDQSQVPEATTSSTDLSSSSVATAPASSSSALAFLDARVIGVESAGTGGAQGGTGTSWSIGISSSLASSSMLLDVPPGEYPPEYPQSLKDFGISPDVKRARVMRSHIQEGAMLMVGPHSSSTYRECIEPGLGTGASGAVFAADVTPLLTSLSVQPMAPSSKRHVLDAFERSKKTVLSLVIPRPQSPSSSTAAASIRNAVNRRIPRPSADITSSTPASTSAESSSSVQPRNRENAELPDVSAQAATRSTESSEEEISPFASMSASSSPPSSSSSPPPPPPQQPPSSTAQRSSLSVYDFPLHSSLSILYTGADGQEEASEAVGTGPTKEFYTLVCREIQRKELRLWIDSDSSHSATGASPSPMLTPFGVLEGFAQGKAEPGASVSKYVVAPCGLHPRPIIVPPTQVRIKESSFPSSDSGVTFQSDTQQFMSVPARHTSWSAGVAHQFEFLGRFVAKALLEKKGLDLPLSKAFLKAILIGPSCASNPSTVAWSPSSTFSIDDIASFDPTFARSLQQLEDLVRKRNDLLTRVRQAHLAGLQSELGQLSSQVTALWEEVKLACIDFTLPVGISGGKDVTLTLLPNRPASEVKKETPEPDNDSHDQGMSRTLAMAGLLRSDSHPEWTLSSAVSFFDISRIQRLQNSSSSRSSIKGSEIDVTLSNLHVYIAGVVRTVCVDGVALQRDAFLRGFSSLCPGSCVLRRDADSGALESDSLLRLFSTSELHELLSGAGSLQDDSLWTAALIEANITVGTHYNARSPQIQWLARAISELTVSERRLFLKFLTGAPRLPPGGFAALQPNRIRIQKMSASDEEVDTRLPAASVCWLEIKVPAYTSFEVLKDRLRVAIYEGNEFFDRT